MTTPLDYAPPAEADLAPRVHAATRAAGVPDRAEALLREIVAAGGLGFVTRETLADAGVPRAARTGVLEALSDSEALRTARAALAAQLDGLPPSLHPAVARLLHEPDPTTRANQAVFAFGAVLRHTTALLLGPFLDQPEEAHGALVLLARPSYGQLWAAARLLAAHPRASGVALAARVERLEQLAAPADLGQGALLSRMLAFRNSLAHGSRALTPQEWQAREPSLLRSLALLLQHLALHEAGAVDPRLLDLDQDGEIGVLEGWDERRRQLNFVGATTAWDSDAPPRWNTWQGVLERAGIARVPLDRLTHAVLGARARASLPAWCAVGDALPLTRAELWDDAAHAPSTAPVLLRARDLSLVVAALAAEDRGTGRAPLLVLEGAEVARGSPAIALSDALGLWPGLADAEPGDAAMAALGSLQVVVCNPAGDAATRWGALTEQLPGLRVWLVERSDARDALPELGHLARELYERLRRRHPKQSLPRWENLAPGARECRWSVARAWTFVSRPALLPTRGAGPVGAALHALSAAVADLGQGRAAELLAEGLTPDGVPERSALIEALTPLDMLRPGAGGAVFADEDTAEAAILYVLRHGTHRVARAVVSRITLAQELEVARLRKDILRERGWVDRSRGLAIERCAVDALDGQTAVAGLSPDEACEAARLLGRWGHPTMAGRVLVAVSEAWPDDARRAALAARTFADVATAEALLAPLASDAAMAHQLAGLLRDRKGPGDRERAAALYDQLLARDDLSDEQRVWSLCADAENRVHRGDRPGALARLDEARGLAERAHPNLVAVVDHRVAFVFAEATEWELGYPFSVRAFEAIGTRADAFAARVLDTHARILDGRDDTDGAIHAAERALRIKRRRADRRGTQMALLLLSQVRAARRDGDAVTPAREALLLAEAAGDVPGMAAAHSRLKTLLRKTDPSAAAEHARRADAYHARTSRGGSP